MSLQDKIDRIKEALTLWASLDLKNLDEDYGKESEKVPIELGRKRRAYHLQVLNDFNDVIRDLEEPKHFCWHCGHELKWGGDQDTDPEIEQFAYVTNLHCPQCLSEVLVHFPDPKFHQGMTDISPEWQQFIQEKADDYVTSVSESKGGEEPKRAEVEGVNAEKGRK